MTPPSDQSEGWMVLDGACFVFFVQCVLIKCSSLKWLSPFIFFPTSATFFHPPTSSSRCRRLPNAGVVRYLLSGRSTSRSVFDCTWVFTHTHWSCEHQRWRIFFKKRQWEGWPGGVGVKFICTQNGVWKGPRTTQLDPVSVNAVTPPSDAHEHSRGNRLAPPTLFFPPFLFTLLSSSTPFAL